MEKDYLCWILGACCFAIGVLAPTLGLQALRTGCEVLAYSYFAETLMCAAIILILAIRGIVRSVR